MIERSHNKLRVLRPRSRDLEPAAADADPHRDRDGAGRFQSGNTVGRHRTAKRSLMAVLKAAVAAQVAGVGAGSDAAPPAPAELARHAITLYRAGQRDLRTDSPIALSHLQRWAVGTAVAQHMTLAAAAAGLETDRGLRLLERAQAAEQRAERASIAALDVARVLRGAAPAGGGLHDHILGKP